MHPDEWEDQQSDAWMRAEAIQSAFRKGAEDESDEHFQQEWEERQAANWADEGKRREAALREQFGG